MMRETNMDKIEVHTTQTLVVDNQKKFKLFDRIKFSKWNEEKSDYNQYTGQIIGIHPGRRNEEGYIILSDITKNGNDSTDEIVFFFSEIKDCDYKKQTMSRIWDILNANDSVVIFDIDGVLAAYEYGIYNHNACRECEWNDFVLHNDMYRKARPLKVLQDYIKRKGTDRVFVCSQANENEKEQKCKFVEKNYSIDVSHIYFVKQKADKLKIINEIKDTFYPNLEDRKFIMVDDTIDVLSNIQDNSGYSTAHISTFMD